MVFEIEEGDEIGARRETQTSVSLRLRTVHYFHRGQKDRFPCLDAFFQQDR